MKCVLFGSGPNSFKVIERPGKCFMRTGQLPSWRVDHPATDFPVTPDHGVNRGIRQPPRMLPIVIYE